MANDLHEPLDEPLSARNRTLEDANLALSDEVFELQQAIDDLRKFRLAVDRSADWIFFADREGRIFHTNGPAANLAGRSLSELFASEPAIPGTPQRLPGDRWKQIEGGNSVRSLLCLRMADGEHVCLDLSLSPLPDESGVPTHYVGNARDITREKAVEDQLAYIALRDPVTGLPNRRLFLERLGQRFGRATFSRRLVAVVVADIDRFQAINDAHGHEAGDEVLREIGRRLTAVVQGGDTVARLGADEFGILLHDVANRDEVSGIVDQMARNVFQPVRIGAGEVSVTLSMGASILPADEMASSVVLDNAYCGLDRARALGGNCFAFRAQDSNAQVGEFLILERHLVNAISTQEFSVSYQPYIDLRTGLACGLEALLRWNSAQFGDVSPARFMPVLERTGMINEVGEWMLDTVCAQIADWIGSGRPRVPVSINLSPHQFGRSDLTERVLHVLERHNVPPTLLVLEVAENTIMHDTKHARSVLKDLRSRGLSVSLDDFGTGHSSLSWIRQLPLDALKIDRSFIANLSSNPQSASVVTAAVQMAHGLGLRAIAEGVETADQLDALKVLGCDIAQGYLLSHPLPARDIARFLSPWPLPEVVRLLSGPLDAFDDAPAPDSDGHPRPM